MDNDRNTLKIQALLEKISNMTAQYENQAADMRVDFTLISQERDMLQARVKELEAPSETTEANQEDTSEPADDSN